MKKLLTVFLALLLTLMLPGCGSADDGRLKLTDREFISYFHKVELTMDNWQDYLRFIERRIDLTDEFGDVYGYYEVYDLSPREWCFISFSPDENAFARITMTFDYSSGKSPDEAVSGKEERKEEITLQVMSNMEVLSNFEMRSIYIEKYENRSDEESSYYKKNIKTVQVTRIKGYVYVFDVPFEKVQYDDKGDYFEVCLKEHKNTVARYYDTGELVILLNTESVKECRRVDWNGLGQLDELNYSWLNEVPKMWLN